MRKYGIFGILFLSLCLFGAVHTAYAAEEEESLQITQEELLDEFDFSDLDDSLKKMFPREKMTFRDVVETLVSGDLKKAGEQFTGFLFDQFFYELQTHRKLLVYLILIAVIAAVFANFSGAFGIIARNLSVCLQIFCRDIQKFLIGGSGTRLFCPIFFCSEQAP